MAEKILDRRVQKTLQLLQNALVELIAEKEYDDITIQEILDRANVGRSTFYSHFENKDQLLRSLLSDLHTTFDEGIRQLAEEDKTWADNSTQIPFTVLDFVSQNYRLFKAMLVQQGSGAGSNPFHNYLLVLTREHFRLMIEHEKHDLRSLDLAIHFFSSAFIGVLAWWLEHNMPCSPQELGQAINQLMLPGLEAVFGG